MLNPELISLENQVFRCYLGWSAVLVLKIFATGIYTGLMRFFTAVSNILSTFGPILHKLHDIYMEKGFKFVFLQIHKSYTSGQLKRRGNLKNICL